MSLYAMGTFTFFTPHFRSITVHKQPFIAAKVTSLETKKSVTVIGLMDTGATQSILTFKTAQLLGITRPKKGMRLKCRTATGRSVPYYLHSVIVQVIASDGTR